MASWEAVNAPSPSPIALAPQAARFGGWSEGRRRLATLAVLQRALGQCLGARLCVWFARSAGIGFVLAALYVGGMAPGALDAVLRMALLTLSFCAGLGALSAAGPAPERILEAGRGLLEQRALPLARLRAQRPLAVALWLLRQIGGVLLFVLLACLALAREPHRVAQLLGLAWGSAFYVLLLAGGLALLAQLCNVLGRSRGQLLFIGVVLVPQLLAPAWPELPTVATRYVQLLDRCLLSLEARVESTR
jgi:hypothetical protein